MVARGRLEWLRRGVVFREPRLDLGNRRGPEPTFSARSAKSRQAAAGRSRVPVGEQRAVRSIRTVPSVWPSARAHTNSPPAIPRRSWKADRLQPWVLVASSFVLGLVLGGAAFVGVWRTTATQADRADAARALADGRLRDADARSARMSRQLHGARANLSVALRQKRHLELDLRSAVRRASIARREAASDHSRLLTVKHQALTVSSDAVALEAYVTTTPNQALDSGFLLAQLTYLSAAARKLQTP
jgi:hypothetical protein